MGKVLRKGLGRQNQEKVRVEMVRRSQVSSRTGSNSLVITSSIENSRSYILVSLDVGDTPTVHGPFEVS